MKNREARLTSPQAPDRTAPLKTASTGATPDGVNPPLPDFEALSRNAGQFVEAMGRNVARLMTPDSPASGPGNEMSDAAKVLGKVAEAWLSDPNRSAEAQTRLSQDFLSLWGSTYLRLQGQPAEPVALPEPRDGRFAHADWSNNPYFDFLKQAYLLTSRWAEGLVDDAEGIDAHTRQKAQFYLRQFTSMLSPSNFLPTNPELIRHTVQENGANLVRGLKMYEEDLQAGGGQLRVRQTDPSGFEVGRNMAVTPGEVVFRNDLIELIQYAPTTETVLKRPFLMVPPWINKFYILDLNPQKSFLKWMVDQGLTVFCISWVNPDERHADKDFESYMREGIEAAIDAIGVATGEKRGDGGRLLRRRYAARRDARHAGGHGQPADKERDPAHHAGRLHPCGRSEGLRRRRSDPRDRDAHGRARLPGGGPDGQRLQHAPAERPDLALHREQLHQG